MQHRAAKLEHLLSRRRQIQEISAAAVLVTDAVGATAEIAESVHSAITFGRRGTTGVTGLVYRSIRVIASLVGKGFAQSAKLLEPLLDSVATEPSESYPRLAVLAALNGVLGDRLQADANALALPMSLHFRGLKPRSQRIVLLVHGLCMNDLQWRSSIDDQVHDHGLVLEGKLDYSPVYLRYNSGLSIAANGTLMSQLLAKLQAQWQVEITELVIVAHSMGGLVSRYAIAQAEQDNTAWLQRLTRIVFLGTPHAGAPLERVGNWLEMLLGLTRYSAPFKRLTGLRSQGINDLHAGFAPAYGLASSVTGFCIAACVAKTKGHLTDEWLGDGLVPLPSAIGSDVCTAKSSKTFYGMNHMALLRNRKVSEQMLRWLA
jgi:pimeloyl-ACP methyl ester carboxylesterase